MVTTSDEVTFRLERLGWISPDQLELSGRWDGLGPERVELPILVTRAAGVEHRFTALPGSPGFEHNGRWTVSFNWDPNLSHVGDVALEFGSGLVLPLPHPSTHQRRFGRPLIKARVPASPPKALVRVEPREPRSRDHTQLDYHASLVQAQLELDEARDELAHAQEEASLARRDAERERERRRAEAERMREALAIAGGLAEDQLDSERATWEEQLAAERAGAEGRLAEERAAADERLAAERAEFEERLSVQGSAVRQQFEAQHAELVGERDAAREQLVAAESAGEELRGRLEQVSDTLAVERVKRSGLREEVDALRAELQRAEQRERALIERHTGETTAAEEQLEALRARLEAAHEEVAAVNGEARRREEELERLRVRLLEAQPLIEDNRRLAAELDGARRVASEAEPLRSQLAEMTRHAAQVEPLRVQLAEARTASEQASAQVTELRKRLQAIGRALGDPPA